MVADVQSRQFAVGQRVARAAKLFQKDGLHVEIATVTRVEEDRVYLNDSKQPLRFPNRVAIVQMPG